MNDDRHLRIWRKLRDLRDHLTPVVDRDPEQEVRGIAVPALDSVISEARGALDDDQVAAQVVEVISPETLQTGEPVRAVDALTVVRILLAHIGPPDSMQRAVRDPRIS